MDARPDQNPPISRAYLPALASALLALAVFSITLGGTYIYDDNDVLFKDSRIRDPSQWALFWTKPYSDNADKLYRPLISTSYAVQWWLHGDRPWAFHLVNLLLHAAVCASLAELSRRLLGFGAALAVGLLYAAHPVHVEAVANIVGQAELLCALGIFSALLLFLKPLTRARACAIFGCFFVAVLSKEQGLLLPLLLLALWPARSAAVRQADKLEGVVLLTLLICYWLSMYIIWREVMIRFTWDRAFLDWTINPLVANKWHPYGGSAGSDRWLMPLILLGRYCALLIAPIKLSPDYGSLVIGWHARTADPYLWLGIAAVVIGCAILGIALYRRNYVCLFAALGFGLTYGMIGNIVAIIGVNFSERLMYIPSAFFLVTIVSMLRVPRRLAIALVATAVVLGSVRSFTYAKRWNDAVSFYQISLREQPKSIRLYLLLAVELERLGRLDEAERVATAGRELLPTYEQAWLESGMVSMDQGKFDEAERYFDQAMKIHPQVSFQWFYDELGRRRAATRTKDQ